MPTRYASVKAPAGHPRANNWGHIHAHILVAEKALGKYLPPQAVVHHADRKTLDHGNTNLVICQDQSYHLLLHQRERAFRASGHANWLKCWHCDRYDSPENLVVYRSTERAKRTSFKAQHYECKLRYERNYYPNRKRKDK